MNRTNSRVTKEIEEIRKAIRKEARQHREDMKALQNLYGLKPLGTLYGGK